MFLLALLTLLATLEHQFSYCSYKDEFALKTVITDTNKTTRLAVLGLINNFLTPAAPAFLEPDDDRRCVVAAIKYALDVVNNRTDLLPDYALEVHFHDAALGANKQWAVLISNFFDEGNISEVIKSPLVMGPAVICLNTDAAMFTNLGKTREYFDANLVYTGFGCEDGIGMLSQYALMLSTYRSVNSLTQQSTIQVRSLLGFAKKVGGWRQIAVLTSTVQSYVGTGLYLLSGINTWAVLNGMEILHFQAPDIRNPNALEQALVSVRQSRARIIFLPSYLMTCGWCIRFWCIAHRVGIRSPKYTILIVGSYCALACTNGLNLTKDYIAETEACQPKSAIAEQLKITFFGDLAAAIEDFGSAPSPPISATTFIRKVLNSTELVSKMSEIKCQQPGDILMGVAASIIATALTLDLTEKRLRGEYNTSLRHLSKINQNTSSRLESKVSADVAADLLQLGGTDGGPQGRAYHDAVVIQVIPRHEASTITVQPRLVSRFEMFFDNAVSNDASRYNFSTQVDSVVWATGNNKPPKDLGQVLHLRSMDDNYLTTLTLSIAASILILFQASLAIIMTAIICKGNNVHDGKTTTYFNRPLGLILVCGCVVLDSSVIVHMAGSQLFPDRICRFRPLLIVLGVTLVNGTLFTRMHAMRRFSIINRYVPSIQRRANVFNKDFYESERFRKMKRLDRKMIKAVLLLIFLTMVAIFVWFVSDPMERKTAIDFADDPPFSQELDSYYDLTIEWCDSATQVFWIAAFCVFNGILLGLACFHASTHKRVFKFCRKRYQLEVHRIRRASFNATTLFIFTILIVFVVPQKPSYLRIDVFAACELLYSATSSGILFYSSFVWPSKWTRRLSSTLSARWHAVFHGGSLSRY